LAKPKPKINAVYETNNSAVFQINKENKDPSEVQSSMQHIDWDPPKLGLEAVLKKQSAIKEEALKQQKKFHMEANTATT
jgi:hypothetical protein